MKHAFRGENKSPAFEFHWSARSRRRRRRREGLQTYAVIFHDVEKLDQQGHRPIRCTGRPSTSREPRRGLPEGLGPGDLPDGTRNGPGIAARGGNPGAYFGPGACRGPFHHYLFEFYALDTKLDLPATTTREDLLKAMEGHILGKAAYTGRFRTPSP